MEPLSGTIFASLRTPIFSRRLFAVFRESHYNYKLFHFLIRRLMALRRPVSVADHRYVDILFLMLSFVVTSRQPPPPKPASRHGATLACIHP